MAKVIHERDVLRQERDFYKMQYQSVKSQQAAAVNGSGASVASGPTAGPAIAIPGLPSPPGAAAVPGGPAAGVMGPSGTPPPRPQSVPTGGKYNNI